MTTFAAESQPATEFVGIYDVPEASRYLKAALNAKTLYAVRSSTMIRWIRRGVASPDLVDVPGHDLLIAFEDLISLRAILTLRAAGVRWPAIDRAEAWLRKCTGARRPFATEMLWVGQGRMLAELNERLPSVSVAGQLACEMLRDYLFPVHGLTFDEKTRMASSWEPAAGVVLEPKVQFGSPCLKGTRIPTRALAGMVEAGDSVKWVASAYRITIEEVQAACEWESRLRAA